MKIATNQERLKELKKGPGLSAGDVSEEDLFASVYSFSDCFDVHLVDLADLFKREAVYQPLENHFSVCGVVDVLRDQLTDLAVCVLHLPPP